MNLLDWAETQPTAASISEPLPIPLPVSVAAPIIDNAPYQLVPEAAGGLFSADEIIDEAFRWFRAQGFPYRKLPQFVLMQQVNRLALTPVESLQHTSEAYSVADTFHPHRFHATVKGKVSPVECFNHDVKFRHALKLRLERTGLIPPGFFGELTISRGTQQCSNFRPGFACLLYRRFCQPGAVVLDTSTGYGGRLVGFAASMLRGHYIGIDPNTLTYHGNFQLADALNIRQYVELHNAPAEDVPHGILAERCDFSFTSPPYFSKEHYSDEATQSWKRYGHSYDAWVSGFLKPMLALTYAALKSGCNAIINIEDVTIDDTTYPLVKSTLQCAQAVGFQHVGTELFDMQVRMGANQEEDVATERVLIFQKG